MRKVNVGDRAGAVVGLAQDGVLEIFGYGKRVKDEVPEEGVYMMGVDMHARGVENPTILLDSGEKVFGCECWWGSEEVVKMMSEEYDIRIISIHDYRKRASEPLV